MRQLAVACHRVNTVAELRLVRREDWVEIDVRTWGNQLILHHDPFQEGESFAQWLSAYHHSGIIVNVKEVGLETQILALLRNRGISEFFFLDQSTPSIVSTLSSGERRVAMRLSDLEPPLLFREVQPYWVWLDSFQIDFGHLKALISFALANELKICLASPELRESVPIEDTIRLRNELGDHLKYVSLVCTKFPQFWF